MRSLVACQRSEQLHPFTFRSPKFFDVPALQPPKNRDDPTKRAHGLIAGVRLENELNSLS